LCGPSATNATAEVEIELSAHPSCANTSSFGHASSDGIIGTRQRMAGFGGTLTVGAGRDNKGTQIRAELPL
jgi:signal transduction histidine kinase